MIYEGISLSRKRGFNVAVISPRVDVVVEISQRIKEVFLKEILTYCISQVNNNITDIL